MKLRRRPRNPRSHSRWATHRSPTQMKNFHLPRPRVTFLIPPLSQGNNRPCHRRNRTIPNQSNNVLRRLLLPMTWLSNSCIQPRNRRVSNAKNWWPLSLARNITSAALWTFNTGNLADLDLQSPARRNLNDRELDAWVELHRTIAQDALAELIKMSQALSRDHPGLLKP